VGDAHTRQVAHTQPEKFAAIEVLHRNPDRRTFGRCGSASARGALAQAAFLHDYFDFNARVSAWMPFPEDRPPVTATAMSFQRYVVARPRAGRGFGAWGFSLVARPLVHIAPDLKVPLLLPADSFVVNEVGWVTAEVGRQPWSVYRLLRTEDAFSLRWPAAHVLSRC